MIIEDYVSYETAKLLKENGFDVYVHSFYDADDMSAQHNEALWNWNLNKENYRFSAPTIQMAMKWLREEHHIFINIDYDPREFGDEPYFTLITNMDTLDYYKGKHLPVNSVTYEQAAEAAIKYCLENFI